MRKMKFIFQLSLPSWSPVAILGAIIHPVFLLLDWYPLWYYSLVVGVPQKQPFYVQSYTAHSLQFPQPH